MMKPHFFIYFLLLISSFGVTGCNSNEDISGGEKLLAGREVSFSAEAGLAKKVAYGSGNGTSIPVYWSASDLIGTYSPQSTTASKSAVYKANEGGGNHAIFSLNTGQMGLTWNSAGTSQSFCSFFPSTAATFSGAEGAAIATATLPSAQNGASTANGFMAGFQYTGADPVKLDFAPLMNVLRLNIVDDSLNVDALHTVSSIVIKSKEATPKKLSGTLKIGYPSSAVSSLSASSFTRDVSSATGDSVLITGSALTSVTNHTLNVTAYLLPQNYSSLKIIIHTNSNKSYVAKIAFSSTTFAQSSVCDLSFGSLDGLTTPKVWDKIDLGCPVNGAYSGTTPVYFASSNLVVEKTASGFLYYLADKTEYMAPTTSYSTDAIGTKRDMFGWADITGWKTSINLADYPSATPPYDICGNASYDIARVALKGGWRLPTKSEWNWLEEYCTWRWGDLNGVPGFWVNGSSNSARTYDKKDHSGNSMFLPAIGYRKGTTVNDREKMAEYLSGQLYSNNSTAGAYLYLVYRSDLFQSGSCTAGWAYDSPYTGGGVRPVTQ